MFGDPVAASSLFGPREWASRYQASIHQPLSLHTLDSITGVRRHSRKTPGDSLWRDARASLPNLTSISKPAHTILTTEPEISLQDGGHLVCRLEHLRCRCLQHNLSAGPPSPSPLSTTSIIPRIPSISRILSARATLLDHPAGTDRLGFCRWSFVSGDMAA